MIQRKVVHTKNKIKEAPAADVVEVVRCKDCSRRYDANECPMCILSPLAFQDYTADDGFCDRGKRRDTDA